MGIALIVVGFVYLFIVQIAYHTRKRSYELGIGEEVDKRFGTPIANLLMVGGIFYLIAVGFWILGKFDD